MAASGQPLDGFCPSCGAPRVAGAERCASCGAPLSQQPARPDRPQASPLAADLTVLGAMAFLFLTLFMPWWEASVPFAGSASVDALDTRRMMYAVLVDCLAVAGLIGWRLARRLGPIVPSHRRLFGGATALATALCLADLASPPFLIQAAAGAYLGVLASFVALGGAVWPAALSRLPRWWSQRTCVACGSPLPEGAKLCPRCGKAA